MVAALGGSAGGGTYRSVPNPEILIVALVLTSHDQGGFELVGDPRQVHVDRLA